MSLFEWILPTNCIFTGRNEGYISTRVCHSVHRGGLPQCMLGYPPPGSRHPLKQAPPRSRHPPEVAPQATPPWSRHPQSGTPPQSGPPAYGQWVAGTHPTGMLSCLKIVCFYHPPTKLQDGNVFAPVCHSVRGGCMMSLPFGGVCLLGGLLPKSGDWRLSTGGMGTKAGGTHPTGMHSC